MPTSRARTRTCGSNAGRNSRAGSRATSKVDAPTCSRPRCPRRLPSEQYDGCDEHQRYSDVAPRAILPGGR
jgi:hypothetical protein